MIPKPGTLFTHAIWRDENGNKLRCVVTAVRRGLVYWRRIDGKKARDYFPVSDWYKRTDQTLSG